MLGTAQGRGCRQDELEYLAQLWDTQEYPWFKYSLRGRGLGTLTGLLHLPGSYMRENRNAQRDRET